MKVFNEVLSVIRRQRKFLVTTHHNPDADALSAALTMGLFLKSLGKQVYVLNEDACPEWLRFLPSASILKKASDIKSLDYDAAIVLDCGDLERIGSVRSLIKKGQPLINIDHHLTNDRFGSINVVDPKASSTSEMIFDLLKEAKHALDRNLAVLLYAGIMTDTGSFRYENTSSSCHLKVAELMSFKISATEMYDRLYVGIPVEDIKLFTQVIHQAHLFCDNRVYCVTLPKKTESRFSQSFDLKEKLFSFLRSVKGVEVIIILTQLNLKETRVNLRSLGDINVAAFAQQFDGGGHRKAAGCKIHQPLALAQKMVCEAIGKKL